MCRRRAADVSLPFGRVPVGIKELDPVRGRPRTEGSVVLKDEIADIDGTMVAGLRQAGIVPVGQATASELGGINCTFTRLHGATGNPYDPARTPGGSSGGSAAAVAGGLLPIAAGGDGGCSIRIPAGFTGMFCLTSTFGRIPKGPRTEIEPLTAALGCLARSVRDASRWFDVCNGADEYDPFSLPRVEGWEEGLGTFDLRGKKVAVAPDLGAAVIAASVRERVGEAAALIADAGLGALYPACEQDLAPEIFLACSIATHHFDIHAAKGIELFRRQCIVAMASAFDEVDFIISATNPHVFFSASGPLPTVIDRVDLVAEHGFEVAVGKSGALTIPANTTGNPAGAVPVAVLDGLPVSMQIIGRHHAEQLLLDLAWTVERSRPWPLVAPGAPI